MSQARKATWAKPGFISVYGILPDGSKYVWKHQGRNYTGEEWAEKVRLERNAKRRARYAADKVRRKPSRKKRGRKAA